MSSDPISAAWTLLDGERDRFDASLLQALEPQHAYLTETEYATYRRGKKIRPLLLLLSGRICQTEPAALPAKMIQAATSLEMLHVATLIHDDIIDAAPQRRGVPSVAAARGTQTAVLIGDMQFIQAIRIFSASVDTSRDMGLVELVLDVGFRLCCGELDELTIDRTLSIDALRMRYFRTIDRKTATLFGLSCEVGASLAGADRDRIYALSQFGWNVGRAFQIMDDIFDFMQPEAAAGKAGNADIVSGRVTLPILYALQEYGPDHLLARVFDGRETSPEAIVEAAHAVANSDGLSRAYALARSYIISAVDDLRLVPPSPFRDAAGSIACHIVDRGFLCVTTESDAHLPLLT
jgi:heptaprenyl diphosphate synthase